MSREKPSEEVTAVTTAFSRDLSLARVSIRPQLIVLTGDSVGQVHTLQGELVTIGRDELATIRLTDAGVSRRHAKLQRASDGHYEVVDVGSSNGTFVNDRRVENPHRLSDGDRLHFGVATVLKYSFGDAIEAHYAEQMYNAALRDGLTGAYNRRYFDERLQEEFAFANRHHHRICLLLIDLDHFKRINDSRGHPVGDQVLMRVATLLQQSIRDEDVLCRYGGEEFAILCREIDRHQATILAERLRHTIDDLRESFDGQPLRVTISVGVAALADLTEPQGPTSLVEAADKALYRAKESGRNCVVTHS